jgi:hypothetical protein
MFSSEFQLSCVILVGAQVLQHCPPFVCMGKEQRQVLLSGPRQKSPTDADIEQWHTHQPPSAEVAGLPGAPCWIASMPDERFFDTRVTPTARFHN